MVDRSTMTPLNRLALLVAQLSPEEMMRFRRWLDQYEVNRWEAAVDLDVDTPRLDEIARSMQVSVKRAGPVARSS
ncbi:MAG: hypothetical protein AAF089_07640 [Bacteroidota bacterium]